jgi:hypothetical protein
LTSTSTVIVEVRATGGSLAGGDTTGRRGRHLGRERWVGGEWGWRGRGRDGRRMKRRSTKERGGWGSPKKKSTRQKIEDGWGHAFSILCDRVIGRFKEI